MKKNLKQYGKKYKQLTAGIETVSYFNGYGFGFWERFSTFSGFDLGFKIGFSNYLVLVSVSKKGC